MELMRRTGNRTIEVSKTMLIEKIKENKERHIEEYEKAVIAYKDEATKQLSKLVSDIEKGEMGIKLNLITPENKSEDYDKVLQMFQWEVKEVVELDQSEFNQYVHDEFDFAIRAKMSNSAYL